MHLPVPDFVLITRDTWMSEWRAQPQGESVEVRQSRRPQTQAPSSCLMTSSPGLGSPAKDAVDSIGCRLLLWEGLRQSHFSLSSPPLMYTSLISWVIFFSVSIALSKDNIMPSLRESSAPVRLWASGCACCLCISKLMNRNLKLPLSWYCVLFDQAVWAITNFNIHYHSKVIIIIFYIIFNISERSLLCLSGLHSFDDKKTNKQNNNNNKKYMNYYYYLNTF